MTAVPAARIAIAYTNAFFVMAVILGVVSDEHYVMSTVFSDGTSCRLIQALGSESGLTVNDLL